jgi:hypothetical protein
MAEEKGGTTPHGTRKLDLDAQSSATTVNTQLLGPLELRPLTLNDLVWVEELEQEETDDGAYVARVLHHQLWRPRASWQAFSRLRDEDMIRIARVYAREQELLQYLPRGAKIESLADVRRLFSASLEGMAEELSAPFAELIGASLELVRASFLRMWDELGERFDILEDEGVPALRRYKWFVTPRLPVYLVGKAVRIAVQPGNQRGAINTLFCGYFSGDRFSNLGTLVEAWAQNPLFQPRMKILRDCVSALACGNRRFNASNVVLPTLIAQIDGISTALMLTCGLTHARAGKFGDTEGTTITKVRWFEAHAGEQRLVHSANDVFLSVLFQTAFPGEPLKTPFTFSRHKIMHGEELRYGRLDNSIRAFLILDFLASVRFAGSVVRE